MIQWESDANGISYKNGRRCPTISKSVSLYIIFDFSSKFLNSEITKIRYLCGTLEWLAFDAVRFRWRCQISMGRFLNVKNRNHFSDFRLILIKIAWNLSFLPNVQYFSFWIRKPSFSRVSTWVFWISRSYLLFCRADMVNGSPRRVKGWVLHSGSFVLCFQVQLI